jgi:hypothetical protein
MVYFVRVDVNRLCGALVEIKVSPLNAIEKNERDRWVSFSDCYTFGAKSKRISFLIGRFSLFST